MINIRLNNYFPVRIIRINLKDIFKMHMALKNIKILPCVIVIRTATIHKK